MENNKVTGIVFFKTDKGSFYYINSNREYIYISDISLINTDKIYKDIIIRTAKKYTQRGFNIIQNRLFNRAKLPIAIEGYVQKSYWFNLDNFIKRKYNSFT